MESNECNLNLELDLQVHTSSTEVQYCDKMVYHLGMLRVVNGRLAITTVGTIHIASAIHMLTNFDALSNHQPVCGHDIGNTWAPYGLMPLTGLVAGWEADTR